MMARHHTWFESSKIYIFNRAIDGTQFRIADTAAGWRATRVCSQPTFVFVQSLNGHCPNGGRNVMVLATASKVEGRPYWICGLRMISLPSLP